MTKTDRIPELDGLRGIAILMVLVGHILQQAERLSGQNFPGWIKTIIDMNWAGVELFFVLSGFLITSILLQIKNKPNYFTNFYARRILRIFPVYYVVLTIIFIIYFVTKRADIITILQTSMWFYTYAHNWLFVSNVAPGLYFAHLWSLAIEEQFYLIWPLVVFRIETKQIFSLGAIAIFVAILFRIGAILLSTEYLNTFPYYSTVTRVDGLMLGAILAAGFQTGLEKQLSKDALKILILASALVSISIAFQPESPLWNNTVMLTAGISGVALLSASLVIIAVAWNEAHFMRRFLRHPSLVFFGKYSYGLYLFLWPVTSWIIDVLSKTNSVNPINWLVFSSACFMITVVLALISWKLVEQPILKFKHYFE